MRNLPGMLKLPPEIEACLFDLDGVVTATAKVHAVAWKTMFDRYLEERAEETGEEFVPFDAHHDYDRTVDGRPRLEGVKSFLELRGIEPEEDLVRRLGDEKQALILEIMERDGVEVYDGTVRFLEQAVAQGLRRAVVSSSANTQEVLKVTGLEHFFEARIDGKIAVERGLPGKPKPDTFLAGAEELGVEAAKCVVFEDALVGVEAGRAGNFGYVVGVDRTGQADALAERGADIVVQDLAELLGD